MTDREYFRKYREEHRDRINENSRKSARQNPHKARRKRLQRLFGITVEQYQTLWDAQKGLCAICGGPETAINSRTKQIKWLSVDHNHETGKIRALLCQTCNSMLGMSIDSSDLLHKAAAYLEKHNG